MSQKLEICNFFIKFMNSQPSSGLLKMLMGICNSDVVTVDDDDDDELTVLL